jgi:hypothetical protein
MKNDVEILLYPVKFPDNNESTGVCESGWPPAFGQFSMPA